MAKHNLKAGHYGGENLSFFLDGKELLPERSINYCNHSPTGFNWGYGGSGPAQLALAIMLELRDRSDFYQTLKWDLIARIRQGSGPRPSFEVEFDLPDDYPETPLTFKHLEINGHRCLHFSGE